MKKNNNHNDNLITHALQFICHWLIRVINTGSAMDACVILHRFNDKMTNAPPVIRARDGCQYGLWRQWGKPVPIRTCRFRRW